MSFSLYVGIKEKLIHGPHSLLDKLLLPLSPLAFSVGVAVVPGARTALWQTVQSVCRLSREHCPPPRYTGWMWSTCQKSPSTGARIISFSCKNMGEKTENQRPEHQSNPGDFTLTLNGKCSHVHSYINIPSFPRQAAKGPVQLHQYKH